MNRSNWRRSAFTFVVCGMSFAWGCGGEKDPPTAPIAPTPPVSGDKAANESPAATETAEKPSAQPGESANASEAQAGMPTSGVKPTKEAAAEVKKIAKAKPLEAQLAQWRRTPFETLQLLECRNTKLGVIMHLASMGDGKRLVLAGKSIVILSVDAKEPEQVVFEASGDQEIKSLAVSSEGQWIAAGDSEGTLRIWDAATLKELATKKVDANDIVGLAISPDSKEIATISYSSDVKVWSAPEIVEKKQFKVGATGINRIEFLTNGELIAAGETMSTWNTSTGEKIRTLTEGHYSQSLARASDGSQWAIVDQDKLHLWNVANAKPSSTLIGGFAANELLTFSPDGKWLASANGSAIRIWDLASRQTVQAMSAVGYPIVGMEWLPQSEVLVVASVNGRYRVWGTEEAGQRIGLKPLHPPIAPLAADSRIPATPAQILNAADLRSMPLLPGSDLRLSSETMLDYEAPVSADDALTFYRYFLEQAGWKEVDQPQATPDSRLFTKDGMQLLASFRNVNAKTAISMNLSDHYDLRWAPKFCGSAIENGYESDQTVMYSTKADLLAIETELLRKMHQAGWTAYARLNSSHSEPEDARDLNFLQNGVHLHISIGKFPAKPDHYTIQSSTQPSLNAIPIPTDCGFVEFDGSTSPMLVANTGLSLAEATDFYDKKLIEHGWLRREEGRSIKEDRCWLAYLRGQCDLNVGLTKLDDGRTLVQVGEGLANTSWQLTKPQAKNESAAKEGIEAADFPVLGESQAAKFNATEKSIEINMGRISLPEAGEQYSKALTAVGWKLNGTGIKDNDYLMMNFEKGDAGLTLRGRISGDNAVINVQGEGLLWSKELPGGKKKISFEAWLRNGRRPASLSLLGDYEKEMRAIDQASAPAAKR